MSVLSVAKIGVVGLGCCVGRSGVVLLLCGVGVFEEACGGDGVV